MLWPLERLSWPFSDKIAKHGHDALIRVPWTLTRKYTLILNILINLNYTGENYVKDVST
jgi:hypothetical protein